MMILAKFEVFQLGRLSKQHENIRCYQKTSICTPNTINMQVFCLWINRPQLHEQLQVRKTNSNFYMVKEMKFHNVLGIG